MGWERLAEVSQASPVFLYAYFLIQGPQLCRAPDPAVPLTLPALRLAGARQYLIEARGTEGELLSYLDEFVMLL